MTHMLWRGEFQQGNTVPAPFPHSLPAPFGGETPQEFIHQLPAAKFL